MDPIPKQVETGDNAPCQRNSPSRRDVIRYGLTGAAAMAGAGGLGYYLWKAGDPVSAGVAEVFKNDAPAGQTWELWNRRGWVKEAGHYLKLGKNVQCKLCPNDCLLEPEDRGRCRDRVNKNGTLYTVAYANAASLHVDPIEKKPLFHFLPASRILSFAAAGCGFRCLNCQNWTLSQARPEEVKNAAGADIRISADWLRRNAMKIAQRYPSATAEQIFEALTQDNLAARSLFPQDVPDLAMLRNCISVAYTYSEPSSWHEYMLDTARLCRQRKLKNVMVTCGYINQKPLEELCDVLDAVNVDLKSFSEDSYRTLNSGKLQPILETLKTLKRRNVWLEVGYLVVPTYTDKPEMFKRLCGWITDNLGVDYPMHFLRFHPQHKLTNLPPTPIAILREARDIARQAGLRYVYLGNVTDDPDAETTFCPGCKKAVITRDFFAVRNNFTAAGKCSFCGTAISGVWNV